MPSRLSSPEHALTGDIAVSALPPRAHALPGNPRGRDESAKEDKEDDDDDAKVDEDLDLPDDNEDDVDDDEPAGILDEDNDEIDDSEDGGDNPLDDAEASDLDAGEDEIDETDEGDANEESEVDVGPLDDEVDIGEENELGDEGMGDTSHDDEGIDLEERAASDDGGLEGTSEAPEDAVDEAALPALDADDDLDEGDEDLAEVLLEGAQMELPPWDAARWTPLEGAGGKDPCSTLAIAAGRVAAAGEALLLVGEGELVARRASFGAGVVAVAAADDLLLTATARGQIAASQGAWTEATSLGALRAGHGPVGLAATPGRGWVLRDRALHRITPPDGSLAPVRARGVLALASSGGTVLLLTEGEKGPVIERLRGDDEGRRPTPLRGPVRRLVEGTAKLGTITLVAAGGRAVAFTDGARIAISRDSGASFSLVAFGSIVALAFAGDDAGATLLILVEGGAVVQCPAIGEATRVAAIEGLGGGPAAIGWDPTRECAWIACQAGLLAISKAPRH
jgi:hypothetical protein